MLMDHHPTGEDFAGLLRSASEPGAAARNLRVLRHLLAECSSCHDLVRNLGWDERPAMYSYSQAFTAVEQALRDFFAEGRPADNTPAELLAELAPLSQDEQARRVAIGGRFANPDLIRKLIDMSHAARYLNAADMLHRAHLARLAAEACTVEIAGSAPRLADLRAQSWRHYANALRLSSHLHEAEEAFAHALRFCEQGTGDPPLRAALLERMASLRISQRRFEQAISLADEAGRIYGELDESHSVSSTMIQKAIAQIYSGDPATAIQTLNRAIPFLDAEGDPHLLLAACHNLIIAYIEMGEPEHALSLYFEARELYHDYQDPLIALRATWGEARLLRGLGHLRAAEAALLRARQWFAERNLLYEVATISLDLSEVYLQLQETGKLHQAVAEMVPIFKALGVDREMLAALLQLQQANEQSRQAFELIRFLSSRLEQLSQQPLK